MHTMHTVHTMRIPDTARAPHIARIASTPHSPIHRARHYNHGNIQ